MTPEYVISLARQVLLTSLLLAAPMLIFGLIAGLVVSIFQAITSIHEMTLTFIPKILAVALALILFLPWMLDVMITFTTNLFTSLSTLAR
ncbi:MAG: flagellar biosynthesis protein FliQ [candidate division KSB1 bacterium]|nr:flagellar biosynthesis protein FliQ [candidate division KSB1 bacterium]